MNFNLFLFYFADSKWDESGPRFGSEGDGGKVIRQPSSQSEFYFPKTASCEGQNRFPFSPTAAAKSPNEGESRITEGSKIPSPEERVFEGKDRRDDLSENGSHLNLQSQTLQSTLKFSQPSHLQPRKFFFQSSPQSGSLQSSEQRSFYSEALQPPLQYETFQSANTLMRRQKRSDFEYGRNYATESFKNHPFSNNDPNGYFEEYPRSLNFEERGSAALHGYRGRGRPQEDQNHWPKWVSEPPRKFLFSNNTGGKIGCEVEGKDENGKVEWAFENGMEIDLERYKVRKKQEN